MDKKYIEIDDKYHWIKSIDTINKICFIPTQNSCEAK